MSKYDPLLLGIDLGTSAVKSLVLHPDGHTVCDSSVTLSLDTPRPGWSEQHPGDWWDATCASVRSLCSINPSIPARVVAIGVSGQMHGATLLDSAGEALRPAILWNDQRSAEECREIVDRVGQKRLIQLVGNRALAGFTAPKLLWIRNHEPEVYARVDKVLLPKDYIVFRLTDILSTEPSDASGTLLFDVVNRRWSSETLSALGIPESWMAPVHSSDSVVGYLTASAANDLGLRRATPVVAGGADNACASLALGSIDERETVVSVGTSGTVASSSNMPRIDVQARLHTFCHVLDGMWYNMGVVLSAGASLRWFRDTLWDSAKDVAALDGAYDRITAAAGTVPPGSDGLLFLPYLSGERTPHADPSARGTWVGLSLHHTRSHLARSVLEGITFALRDSLELMRELGIDSPVIRVTGGGARSRFWLQLMADTFGRQVLSVSSDGPGFGAALLAGLGGGVFGMDELRHLVKHKPDAGYFVPASDQVGVFNRQYAVYRDLYPALTHIFDQIPQTSAHSV